MYTILRIIKSNVKFALTKSYLSYHNAKITSPLDV